MPLGTHVEIRGQFGRVVPMGTTSFHHVGPRNQTQVIMINGKNFYPLNCIDFCGLGTFRNQG